MGGQAVIEGVMMRSPKRISLAVRLQDKSIKVVGWDFSPVSSRSKFLRLPVIRGAVNLGEMLYWGIKTLQLSAEIVSGGSRGGGRAASVLSLLAGLAAGVLLFAYIPLWTAAALGLREKPLPFNLVAGSMRVVIFLGYIGAISLMKDIRRLFQYHGAEHKAINAFERGEPLLVERVRQYPKTHPRCGTSFILIVAIVAIIFFAVFDGAVYALWNFAPKPLTRLFVHLALLPLLAGASYEVLKLTDRLSRKSWLGRFVAAPGMWLQKITTRQPDDDMLEVAIAALLDSISNISVASRSAAKPAQEREGR